MVEIEPEPELSKTFTAHNLAPGATPTMPIVLSLALLFRPHEYRGHYRHSLKLFLKQRSFVRIHTNLGGPNRCQYL